MALNDFPDIAAATTAGYKFQVTDLGRVQRNGLPEPDRFIAGLEKWMAGDPDGGSGNRWGATGVGPDAPTATANALSALNNVRLNRYGADSGRLSKGKRTVASHVKDIT